MRRDSPRPVAVLAIVRGALAVQQVRTGVSLRIAQDQQIMDFAELDYTGNANELVVVNPSGTGLVLTPTAPSGLADGDYGDIIVSGGGTVMSVDATIDGENF